MAQLMPPHLRLAPTLLSLGIQGYGPSDRLLPLDNPDFAFQYTTTSRSVGRFILHESNADLLAFTAILVTSQHDWLCLIVTRS
jgi:hypothetical protein